MLFERRRLPLESCDEDMLQAVRQAVASSGELFTFAGSALMVKAYFIFI